MAKSIKGKEVNFTELKQKFGDTVAIGNANMNARGDLLGPGGKIIKTSEQLAREYHSTPPNATKNVPLSDEINQMLAAPAKPKVQTSKVVLDDKEDKKK